MIIWRRTEKKTKHGWDGSVYIAKSSFHRNIKLFCKQKKVEKFCRWKVGNCHHLGVDLTLMRKRYFSLFLFFFSILRNDSALWSLGLHSNFSHIHNTQTHWESSQLAMGNKAKKSCIFINNQRIRMFFNFKFICDRKNILCENYLRTKSKAILSIDDGNFCDFDHSGIPYLNVVDPLKRKQTFVWKSFLGMSKITCCIRMKKS